MQFRKPFDTVNRPNFPSLDGISAVCEYFYVEESKYKPNRDT